MDPVYFAYTASLLSQMAAAIGRADGALTVDAQTAHALALFLDLVPADRRLQSGKILAEKLRSGRQPPTPA